ncbi:proteinase-activated receptor 3-like isoform X1 [Dermochelys coriacea]|uniref:proteinase-activated receptor 3-like isoform X1 n=2 Tax=Dermochelys coriacea TaxID=27794 RepID=UPI0018E799A7|nr:proteinase-activated receptor 3-like isoform X1 [Dermochelys coriacea]
MCCTRCPGSEEIKPTWAANMMSLKSGPYSAALCTSLLLTCTSLGWAEQCPTAPRQTKGRAMIRISTCEEAGRNTTFSSSWLESHLRSPVTTLLLPMLYSTVLLIGLPANALAFWVLATKTKKCSSTVFMLNLAGADLLFALLLPFKISYHLLGNNWLFGDYACCALVTLFYGNMYGSILFLTCISVDRYISLVHPFLWRGSSHVWQAVGVCVGVWLAVGLGLSPLLRYYHSQHVPELNITTCHDILELDTERELAYYFPALVVLGFAAPFILITFSYTWVLGWLLLKRRHYGHVVRLLTLVLLVFALCFTPSNVLLFFHYLQPQPEWHNRTYTWYVLALAVSAFNNCIDPFIYFYVSRDFRARLWARPCCWRGDDKSSSGRASENLVLPQRSSEQCQL